MVSPTAATFYFYKSFWSVLRSQALETPQLGFRELNGRKSCWTWPGSAPKPPKSFSEPSSEACWTWLGSAPKPPRTFSGTFSKTLLNLSWLCTKTSHTFSAAFSGTFFGTLLNLTWLCTKAFPTFSGTFSGTLLSLTSLCTKASQTSPGTLLRNLLRNPVERDLALHQSLPEPSPEPSPEYRWTWPGACTSAHRTYSGLKTPLAYAAGEKMGKVWKGMRHQYPSISHKWIHVPTIFPVENIIFSPLEWHGPWLPTADPFDAAPPPVGDTIFTNVDNWKPPWK